MTRWRASWRAGRTPCVRAHSLSLALPVELTPSLPCTRPVAGFTRTGLERGEALAHDIAWFQAQGVTPTDVGSSGPGREYAAYLQSLAKSDPQSFLCHWYNVYFTHTAGGRMIGAKVTQVLELPPSLRFYAWEGDLNAHMAAVREAINQVAEGWTREEKDRCLGETQKSFELSGKLLRLIA